MQSMPDQTTNDRVCIIGAGPSGLATGKMLREANIPFDCFEANRGIGGLWDVEGSQSGGYRSLHTNTSKAQMAFSDFPFPDESPQFPSHSELLDYFNAYVDHFGFREQIRVECRVTHAKPTAEGTWQIELEDGSHREYGACIVATGQYGTRRWPDPPTPGRFAGQQIHAAEYLDPDTPVDCRGKRVVVVGLGSSAAEIATELAGGQDGPALASHIVLSARSGRYILPKLFHGEPLDSRAPHPSQPLPGFVGWLPEAIRLRLLRAFMKRSLGKVEAEIGRPSDWNLPNPTFGPWAERPTLSEGFIPALEAGRIESRPGIARFDESTIQFRDGSKIDADVVIWATGYRPGFPFLDDEILGCPADELALYRRIGHPSRPNLYFVGFTRVICSLWPVSEQQAKWLVGVLKGAIKLPSPTRQARASIQVSKTLPVFCNSYVADLRREGG
jgi:cation diffusion facilitator CzcD-associated flavoprotein CzcO